MPYGTLELQILEGRNLKDTDFIGKSDPYCILRAGSQQHRTKTINRGGKNPVWNEDFKFNLTEGINSVTLSVWDEDPGRDDQIGEGSFDLSNAFRTGVMDQWVNIRRPHSNKSAGDIHIVCYFRSQSGVVPPYPSAAYPGQQYPQTPPLQQQYPPSQQYPPQGYPPQGYPPQGYPPQQQYPTQVYPPSSNPYAPPGYPGYVPTPNQPYPPTQIYPSINNAPYPFAPPGQPYGAPPQQYPPIGSQPYPPYPGQSNQYPPTGGQPGYPGFRPPY